MNRAASNQAVPMSADASVPMPAWMSRVDWPYLLAAVAIVAIGLVMVASASVGIASKSMGSPLAIFWRQCIYVLVALTVAGVLWPIPMALWRRFGGLVMLASIFGLVLVLIPGVGLEANAS